jgi:hypothetical protein
VFFDRQFRIVRQRELVAKLEQRDDSAAVLACACSVLAGLELGLADLIGDHERARRNEAAKPRLAIDAPSFCVSLIAM